jgi:hypothetical protein
VQQAARRSIAELGAIVEPHLADDELELGTREARLIDLRQLGGH